MLDNYIGETRPLLRLLRTPAFRFVLVYFNHYSLRQQLKKDLQKNFPDRPVAEADVTKVSYRELADAYYRLGEGFFFIDNFEGILAEPEKYIGLNLRRDKLAQYPIALICFISPGTQTLIARDMMEKMPDLWSFHSQILDLKTELVAAVPIGIRMENHSGEIKISTLGGSSYEEKIQELERLQNQIEQTPPHEAELLTILLRQVKDIQKDVGFYKEAIRTIEALIKDYETEDEGIVRLYIEKGDLYEQTGNYENAIQAFETAILLSEKSKDNLLAASAIANRRLGALYLQKGDMEKAMQFLTIAENIFLHLSISYPDNVDFKSNLAISYQYLGNVQSSLGNLQAAIEYYEKYNNLVAQLHQSYPDNIDFKNGLAVSYSKLGKVQSSLGNLEAALAYYEHDTQLSQELHQSYPDNIDFKNGLAISYSKLGEVQSSLGNSEAVLAYYEKYNQLEVELYQSYPHNIRFKKSLAISYSKLGNIQSSLGNLQAAIEYYEKYNNLVAQLHQSYPDNIDFRNGLAISYFKLGNVQLSMGNLEAAQAYYEQYNQLEAKLHQSYPDNVEFKNNLAGSFLNLGQLHQNGFQDKEKAAIYLQSAKKIWTELATAFPDYAEFRKNMDWVEEVLLAL